jgi:cell division protein FtsB
MAFELPSLRPARLMIGALIVLLLMLQWSIWFGAPDAFDALALRAEIADQRIQNEGLRERNQALGAEVRDLKQGSEAVEERARSDLGMVKKDETFYQVIPPAPTSGAPAAAPTTAPSSGARTNGTTGDGDPAPAAPTTPPERRAQRDRRP